MAKSEINSVIALRSRLGVVVRTQGPTSAEASRARRDLAAAKIEKYVRETVTLAPPLTLEQTSRIVALLGGSR